MSDVSRILTTANASLLILVVLFFSGYAIVKGMLIDRMTPLLFWLWLIGTPFVCGAALITSKKAAKRGYIVLNSFLLFFWAIGFVGSLLLH